jgi:hypothetical protein
VVVADMARHRRVKVDSALSTSVLTAEMGQGRPGARCRWARPRQTPEADARLAVHGRQGLRRDWSGPRTGQHDGPNVCGEVSWRSIASSRHATRC